MKKDIHPKNYRLVAFRDMSNEHTFITKSTVNTKEEVGKMKLVDTAGRVDKYMNRYKKHLKK